MSRPSGLPTIYALPHPAVIRTFTMQLENERHSARLDEKLPSCSNAFDEVCKEMSKKQGSSQSAPESIDREKNHSSEDKINREPVPMPRVPKDEPPKPEPKPEPRWPREEPTPIPKFPRIDEPFPKAPPKVEVPLPKFPKQGEPGHKSPIDLPGSAGGGRGQSGEGRHRERDRTDCGFGGGNHSDGGEKSSPADRKFRSKQEINVMNQFPHVELFTH